MKNLISTYKVLRTDVELDVKEISYLVDPIDGCGVKYPPVWLDGLALS